MKRSIWIVFLLAAALVAVWILGYPGDQSPKSENAVIVSSETGVYGVPLPLQARLIAETAEAEGIEPSQTYKVSLTTSQIRSFYREHLANAGWKSAASTEPRRLNFENGHQLLAVITPSATDTFILRGGRQ